jgi:2,4-dienoyl-CoA reductase (NADPH2)
MTQNTENVDLFSPYKLGRLELPKRIVMAPMTRNRAGPGEAPGALAVTYYAQRASAGLIITEGTQISQEGQGYPGTPGIFSPQQIAGWTRVTDAVHAAGGRIFAQLWHVGRISHPSLQPGGAVPVAPSALQPPGQTMTAQGMQPFVMPRALETHEIARVVDDYRRAAANAKRAGFDGVELHGANGYLITQFLSSGINDRKDEYGGSLENRARFLLDIVDAIRARVGRDFQLQVKISAIDYNNVIPWEGRGNTLQESIQICKWVEEHGADALHVSMGSLFPHPLNPPGDFAFDTITRNYDAMLSSGTRTLRNYFLFRYRVLRPIFYLIWFRQKWGKPVEGVGADSARAIKRAVSIPVISTGGWQHASLIADHIDRGDFDAVSMARALLANHDLLDHWRTGRDVPERPCTHCNKCLLNAPKHPLGCYELSRFPDFQAMVDEIVSVYRETPPPARSATT